MKTINCKLVTIKDGYNVNMKACIYECTAFATHLNFT